MAETASTMAYTSKEAVIKQKLRNIKKMIMDWNYCFKPLGGDPTTMQATYHKILEYEELSLKQKDHEKSISNFVNEYLSFYHSLRTMLDPAILDTQNTNLSGMLDFEIFKISEHELRGYENALSR